MKPRDIFFPAVVIAIILFLVYLSTIGRKAPAIPGDAAHVKITDQRACLDCHAPGKVSPLKQTIRRRKCVLRATNAAAEDDFDTVITG